MDDIEINRLRLQQNFLMRLDGNIYKETIEEYSDVSLLDVGCADGTYITRVLEKFNNIKNVFGVDYNELAIAKANSNKKENFDFVLANIEEPIFESIIKDYLAKHKLTGFTIINISLVLLHIKYPEKLLRILRHYLIPGGTIIIKDVDDDFRVAYPDKNGLFEKAKTNKSCQGNFYYFYYHDKNNYKLCFDIS